MSKFGAFVAGLGTGYATGSRLRLANERGAREAERWKWEKEQRERERDVWKQLADLAEKHGGFATPPRIEQRGIMPPATPMMPAASPPDAEPWDQGADDQGEEE